MTERYFSPAVCRQLCPAGLITLSFTLFLQGATHGLDRAVPTSPSPGVTLELSKTNNSKLCQVFAWERQLYPVPQILLMAPWLQSIYLTLNEERRGKKKKDLKKKREISRSKHCLIFSMNNAMAAVWHRAFCPHHGFSIIRILKVSFPSLSNVHR